MGTTIYKIIFFLTFYIVSLNAFSVIDKLRIVINSDPSTTATIAYNATNPNTTVYYDQINFGSNYTLYSNFENYTTYNTHITLTVMAQFKNIFTELSNLTPNTIYYFVIRDNVSGEISDTFYFQTGSDDDNEPLSLIACGDSRGGLSGGNLADVTIRRNGMSLVSKLKPNAVLFSGDMVDTGTSNAEWDDWLTDWQLTIGTDGRVTPIMPAQGNHENNPEILVNIFNTVQDVYYNNKFSGNLLSVYALNSEIQIPGNQTNWLSNELMNDNSKWKIAFYHKGMRPHVSFKNEGINQYAYWSQLFYDYDVQLAIESDSHCAKRTFQIAPCKSGLDCYEGFRIDKMKGTTYVGEGSFGAPLRNPDDIKPWTRDADMLSQFNWIFVYPNKIENRSVIISDPNSIPTLANSDRFQIPSNLNIWNPSNGEVVEILDSSYGVPDLAITQPTLNQTLYTSQINIEVTSSNQSLIDYIEIYIDGDFHETLNNAPYQSTYLANSYGTYEVWAKGFNANGSSTEECISVQYLEQSFYTKQRSLYESYNDVNENIWTGSINSNPNVLYAGVVNGGQQIMGLRFENLHIPPEAIIDSAYLSMVSAAYNSIGQLLISGEKSGQSLPFGEQNYSISTRTKTNANYLWTYSGWNSNQTLASGNIAPIIQEIVNESDFDAGSPFNFILESAIFQVTVKSADRAIKNEDSTLAPLLYVSYHINSSSNQAPSVNIDNPQYGDVYFEMENIYLDISSSDPDGTVQFAILYLDNNFIDTVYNPVQNQSYTLQVPDDGTHSLQVQVVDNDGISAVSPIVQIEIIDPIGCPAPQNLTVASINGSSATFFWNTVTDATDYTVYYRLCNAATWTSLNSTLNFAVANYLPGCSCVEYYVVANCPSGSSAPSNTLSFTTDGCLECDAIQNLISSNVLNSSAILSWDLVPDSDYELYLREIGEPVYDTIFQAYPIAILILLPECTPFEWFVKVNCNNGLTSSASELQYFATSCSEEQDDEDISRTVNTEELNIEDQLVLFPLPVNDALNIKVESIEMHDSYLVNVYSSTGQLMLTQKMNTQNNNISQLNFKEIEKGIYFVEVNYGNNKRLMKKIIK